MFNSQKMQKALLVILEGLIYLSFSMPFIYLGKSIFPFIVGKILYFQIVVQAMVAFYLMLLALDFRKYAPKRTVLLYGFCAYAASLLLSAIFGIDFERSFWSNFERMTGVFVVWHFIAYAIIISVVLDGWPKIKRALQVLLAFSMFEALVIAAQYMKAGVFLYPNKGGRVWGTLGNSIYIGSYFIFHIVFALLLAFKEKKQIWQIVYLFIAGIEAFIIIHSRSSRGADLALLFSVAFIIFAYGLLIKNKKVRLIAGITLLSGFLILGALFIFRTDVHIKKMPFLGAMLNSSLSAGTGRTRTIAWEIAVKAFEEKPVFGIGLENFYFAFNKYYNPESLLYSYYETWFDRSHSIIFDTLSTGGAVGFVSFFGLFAIAIGGLFSRLMKGADDKHIFVFFSLALLTYLIQNLFVFDHPGSYLLIYFSFGLLLSILGANGSDEKRESKYALTAGSFSALCVVIFTGFLVLFFLTSVRTYKAASGIIEAESYFAQNPSFGLQKYGEILSSKTPFIDDMRSTMAKRIVGVNQDILTTAPAYKTVLLFARDELIKQVKDGSKDVYDYLLLGQVDTLLATSDVSYLTSADKYFEQASVLSPKRQQIYYTWAKTRLLGYDNAGAKKLLEYSISLEPGVPDSYWYLGFVYNQEGDEDTAWSYIKKAVDKKYAWKSQNEVYFAANLAEKMKDDESLARIFYMAVGIYPGDGKLLYNLGQAYLRLGEQDKAMEVFEQAQKLSPELFKK